MSRPEGNEGRNVPITTRAYLRIAREELGDSMAGFADRAGIKRNTYKALESGTMLRPRDDVVNGRKAPDGTVEVEGIIGALGALPEGSIAAENAITALVVSTPPSDLTKEQIAARSAILTPLLQLYEGKTIMAPRVVPQDRISMAMDAESTEVDKILDRKWFATFARGGTFPLSILSLQLDAELGYNALVDSVPYSKNVIDESRTGKKTLNLETVNALYESFYIPADGLAVQLFRLQSQGISPLNGDSFASESRGKLVKYYRVLKGQYQRDAAKEMGIAESDLIRIENNKIPISEARNEKILAWLGLSKEEPLGRALSIRFLTDEAPSQELLEQITGEVYVFAGPEGLIPPLSTREKIDIAEIVAFSSVGAYIRHKRAEMAISQSNFAAHAPPDTLYRSEVNDYENGKTAPRPKKAFALGRALGWQDIHDARMLALVEKADGEQFTVRAAIRQRQQTKVQTETDITLDREVPDDELAFAFDNVSADEEAGAFEVFTEQLDESYVEKPMRTRSRTEEIE